MQQGEKAISQKVSEGGGGGGRGGGLIDEFQVYIFKAYLG